MPRFLFDVVAYATIDGEAVCLDHGDPDMEPIFVSDEFDSYPTCVECNAPIEEVSLSADGAFNLAVEEADRPYPDRFDFLSAAIVFWTDYHSGQASKGYERLCRASRHISGRYVVNRSHLSDNGVAYYRAMRDKLQAGGYRA